MDETTFSLDWVLRRCWMKRGTQKTCPAHTGYRHQIHLIGGLDWASDQVHAIPVERKNSTTFSTFLEWLCLEVYPDQPLMLVLDNVSYHHSANVMALLAVLQPRVQVLWLPKYSPDMNPIERFWLHLKNAVYANRLFPSLTHLLEHIQLWLSYQNSFSHPDRLSFSKSFRSSTWLHFKQLTVANRLHRSLKELQHSVDEVMQQQNTLRHPNRLLLPNKFRLVA